MREYGTFIRSLSRSNGYFKTNVMFKFEYYNKDNKQLKQK